MFSILIQYIAGFRALMKAVEMRINGSKEALQYTYTQELVKEFSPDLKFEAGSIDGTVVTVDVVAMDSDLPLKKWDSITMANGDIPKLGAKKQLSERMLSDIDILERRNADSKVIVSKLFSGIVKLVAGVSEKLQYMYDQALSSGMMLVDDDTNTGTGIRVNFGYLNSNMFGAVTAWSNPASKPLDDIKRVTKFARGKGDTISIIKMDDATFDNFAKNAQVKEQFAFTNGFVGANIPNPDLTALNNSFRTNSQYRFEIQIMDRTVTTEKNGVRTTVQTWTPNKIVFLTSSRVGRLVYGELAEATRPTKSAEYVKVDDFILTKLWRSDEPFSENYSVQALVLPVIDNASSIYVLDAEEADASVQNEGNANFNYKAVDYTKVSVAAALKLANPKSKITSASTDALTQIAVNELSDAQIVIFEANIVAA